VEDAERFDTLAVQSRRHGCRLALEHQEFRSHGSFAISTYLATPALAGVLTSHVCDGTPPTRHAGLAATLLNTEGAAIEIRGLKIESMPLKRDRSQFDLTFVMEEFQTRSSAWSITVPTCGSPRRSTASSRTHRYSRGDRTIA